MTTTSTDRSGDVMPTGINVDRMEWWRELRRQLGVHPVSDYTDPVFVGSEAVANVTRLLTDALGDVGAVSAARSIVALVLDDPAVRRTIDRAMTAARMQALLDVTEYDPEDATTWPRDGQGVAVEMMFMSTANVQRPLWVSLTGEYEAIEATSGDRWLWVPPEATDG